MSSHWAARHLADGLTKHLCVPLYKFLSTKLWQMVVAVTATVQYWADSFRERNCSSLGTLEEMRCPFFFEVRAAQLKKAGFAI